LLCREIKPSQADEWDAMDELTREFLIESQEGLDRMERCLTDLEERPQDAGLIGDIFRSVHTIKGTTGFLGFKRLEKLAHAGENLLGLLRENKLTANEPIITGLLQLLDGLRSILKTIEAQDAEGEGEDVALIARLEELQQPGEAQVKTQTKAESKVKQPAHARAGGQAAKAPPPTPAARRQPLCRTQPPRNLSSPIRPPRPRSRRLKPPARAFRAAPLRVRCASM
jgi:two-component system chemotaxis sensor kinase CheA